MSLGDKVEEKYGSMTKFMESLGFKSKSHFGDETGLICPNHTSHDNVEGKNCHCNDSTLQWNCFSCGEGGGVIHAVAFAKGCSYGDAKAWLLEDLGLRENKDYTDIEVRRIYADACHKLLLENKGEGNYAKAWAYIKARGLKERIIRSFRLGYADGWAAISILRKKGISEEQMESAGILHKSKKSGKLYPFFSGRVTLMSDINLYGRTIDSTNTMRHLYTSDRNSILNKGMLGVERDIVLLVEGQFDTLTAEQYNRELHANWVAVGSCGTKGISIPELTKVLKEANPAEIIVVPDSDPWKKNGSRHAVGQKAGLKKAMALEKAGFKVRVMVLPENSDMNDLSKNGATSTEYEALVQKAGSPAKYAIYCMAHYHAVRDHSGNLGFLAEVKKFLSKECIPLKSEIINYLVLLTGESKDDIQKFMEPSMKRADALEYIRTEMKRGKSIEDIINSLKTDI